MSEKDKSYFPELSKLKGAGHSLVTAMNMASQSLVDFAKERDRLLAEVEQLKKQRAELEAEMERYAEAEKTIAADKALVAQYNEHLRKNLYNELADIICRSGVIDSPNMVVDSVELITNEPRTMGVKHFDIVLHCLDFDN